MRQRSRCGWMRCWAASVALACGAAFGAPSPEEAAVERVLVVFKTHLDVGFTDLSSAVTARYVGEFLPKAMDVIEALEAEGGEARYVWTTGAWLIDRYLRTAGPEARARLEGHLRRGTVAWTAVPYTVESEALSRPLFSAMLGLSQRLDRRYGRRTVAAKMTDVPGHTRGIVAPLCAAGVTFLHVGVNPASAVPEVPRLCRWRAATGESLILMYQGDYGATEILPDGRTALSLNFTGDNHGPHTVAQVKARFAELRRRFPNATLEACSLNAVAEALEPLKETLPEVTAEIGDTWIYGFASAPSRMARFRAVMACFDRWVATGALTPEASVDVAVALGMVAEHTWGVDVKTFLKAWDCYAPEAFRAARGTAPFRFAERSWAEVDGRLAAAVALLPAPLRAEAEAAMAEAVRAEACPIPPAEAEAEPWRAALPGGVGAVGLCYQTLDAADYERFFGRYLRARPGWALCDFGKPGLGRSPAESAILPAHAAGARAEGAPSGRAVVRELVFPAATPLARELLPRRVQVRVEEYAGEPRRADITVTLLDKPAVRLPEAYWLRFDVPGLRRLFAWKTGERIDLMDVAPRGARRQHGVGEAVELVTDAGTLRIRPHQAFLLNVGREMGLSYDVGLPSLEGGVQFCLLNNFWGTNFQMWCEGSMRFRFTVEWEPRAGPGRDVVCYGGKEAR